MSTRTDPDKATLSALIRWEPVQLVIDVVQVFACIVAFFEAWNELGGGRSWICLSLVLCGLEREKWKLRTAEVGCIAGYFLYFERPDIPVLFILLLGFLNAYQFIRPGLDWLQEP